MIRTINLDTTNIRNKYDDEGNLVLDRKQKALRISRRLLQVLQSKEFRDAILRMNRNYWLAGETTNSPFIHMNNEEIYKYISEGKEETNSDIDYELDMQLRTYLTNNFVVGYMIPFRPDIWVNTKYFDTKPDNKVCSNLLHEYLHTLGSRHGGNFFRQSLPYYMNNIVNDLYNKPLTSLADPVQSEPVKAPVTTRREPAEAPVKTKKICRPWWAFWRGPRCIEKVVA